MSKPAILCPIDFSDASRGALRHAAAIAHQYDADLTVLTVNDPLLVDVAALQMGPAWLPGDSLRELHRFVAETFHGESPIPTLTFDVASGKPAMEILRSSNERRCDLVVMSSRGLTGVRKLFFGATTERVLRETTRAVLVTPPLDPGPKNRDELRRTIRRILVPVDLSAGHPQVEVAGRLGATLDASVLLAHVVEPLRFPVPADLRLPSVDAERRSQAERLLDALAVHLPRGVRYETLVAFGDPAEEIAKIAHDRQANLVSIGLHASSLGGPRMGSVTYRVLCLSHTPVLALPPTTIPHAGLARIITGRAASTPVPQAAR